MSKFIAYLDTAHWSPKNRLEEKCQQIAHSFDTTYMENDVCREQFFKDLEQAIADACAEFPRCKAVKLNIWQPRQHEKKWMIYCPSVFTIAVAEIVKIYN